MKKTEKSSLKKEIYTHIHSYNRYLTTDYLDTLNWVGLLRNCHPIEREHFMKHLERADLIIVTPKLRDSLFVKSNPHHKTIKS